MSIYRGAGGSGDATNDATVSQVQTYASQAATSATNAAASATSAAGSASTAAAQATLATSAKNDSQTNATTVAGYVAGALASQTAAAGSATSAAASALLAGGFADAASVSASNASSSASTATTQATAASTSATNSANSAASALAIYGNTTAMNTAVSNAATSASSASTSAANASTSASNAATSASNALSSGTSAATSAANAAVQVSAATAIYGDITAVQNAATNSTANKNAAAASASAASTSASASATSATSSATSASAAATSAAAASAVALGNEPVRHSVRPSLLLDFANTKQLDPRITFTRASTATFYDGKTTAKAEENLLLQSQTFENASWAESLFALTRTANTTTSPDGTTTADSWSGDGTNAYHYSGQLISLSSSLTYSFSLYVKANGVNAIQIILSGGTGFANFDVTLGAGAVGTFSSPFSSLAIQDVGNGWFRCSCLITSSTASNIYIALSNNPSGARASQAFTTSSGVFLWGAQLEQRSYVTAYTPTTTAAITNYIPALQTAASGVARFDHNPTTGESLGLLIEEQRVNLLLQSSQISVANSWNTYYGATSVVNTTIAPDGTLSASSLYPSVGVGATGVSAYYSVLGSVTSGAAYTFSIFAKAGSLSSITLGFLTAGSGINAIFNLTTGAISGLSGATATSYLVGNGWWRCSITVTTSSTTHYPNIGFYPTQSAGTNLNNIFVWGAQLEAGAFATSYIPTVASQVTRSPDAASLTGTNFSSWYRQDEGTVYSETVDGMPATSSARGVWSIDDGTTSNRLDLRRQTSTDIQNFITVNGVTQANLSYGYTAVNGVSFKNATVYKFNDIAGTLNSGTIQADSSAQIPVVSGLRIGVLQASSVYLSGAIKKIAYYPKRLTNAELQGLTTV